MRIVAIWRTKLSLSVLLSIKPQHTFNYSTFVYRNTQTRLEGANIPRVRASEGSPPQHPY